MKPLLLASLLVALVAFPACSSVSNDTATARSMTETFDINKILSGITDAPSAEAAKGPLESAVAALKSMTSKADGTGAARPADAAGGMKKVSADVLAKFGVSGETMGTITSLLGNPAISGVIGPVLNQLKGMIGM